jgi:glucose/arabinose dehydrogenase
MKLILFGLGIFLSAMTPVQGATDLSKIRLPKGFHIDLFSDKVPNARQIAVSPSGTVFLGTRTGVVFALVDNDKDFKADQVYTIADGLNQPNGVDLRDGNLFVAEIHRILRFDNIEKNLSTPPKPVVIYDKFPKDTHHGWKFIRFGPDGLLYVPVGAPCNICEANSPMYQALHRMKPDGTGIEVFASGIRNTVGFDWDPSTQELWFTDNGRDMLGDDIPPDELNHAAKSGMNFGYPYCHAGDISDPEYGKKHPCSEFEKPAQKLGPHVAALGMRFYSGSQFPKEYRQKIFIAEHGSWNRSQPIGYRISTVTVKNGKASDYKTFAEGWLQGASAWGRPVDVQPLKDGSLLVSDDEGGRLYRISYDPKRAKTSGEAKKK